MAFDEARLEARRRERESTRSARPEPFSGFPFPGSAEPRHPRPSPLDALARPGPLGSVSQRGGGYSSRKTAGVQDERLGPGEHEIPLMVPGNERAAMEVEAGETDPYGRPVIGGRRTAGREPTRDEVELAIAYEAKRRSRPQQTAPQRMGPFGDRVGVGDVARAPHLRPELDPGFTEISMQAAHQLTGAQAFPSALQSVPETPQVVQKTGSMFHPGEPGAAVQKAELKSALELAETHQRQALSPEDVPVSPQMRFAGFAGQVEPMERPEPAPETRVGMLPEIVGRGAAEIGRLGVAAPFRLAELSYGTAAALPIGGPLRRGAQGIADAAAATRRFLTEPEPGTPYERFLRRTEPQTTLEALAEAVGQTGGFALLAGASAAAGLPAKVLPAVTGGAVGISAGAKRHEQLTAPAWKRLVGALAEGGLGTLEALPVARMLERLNKATGKKLLPALLKRVGQAGLEESIQGAVQEAGAVPVAKWMGDTTNWSDLFAEVPGGAGLGGGAGAIVALLTEAAVPGMRRLRVATRRQKATGVVATPEEQAALRPRPMAAPLSPEEEAAARRIEVVPPKTLPVAAVAVAPEVARAAQPAPAAPVQGASVEGKVPRGAPAKTLAGGAEGKIITPAGEHAIRYELVDAADLIPSHKADTFAKRADYPAGIQERPYHTDKGEQAKVIRQALKFEPSFVVATTPDAINGPPILASDSNVVLGGNSRAMTIQRVLAAGGKKAEAYREAIRGQAAAVGLDPAEVEKLFAAGKAPVLVRRLSGVPASNIKKSAQAARHFNIPLTQALSQEAAAVSRARTISTAALDEVDAALTAAGDDATLRDALRQGPSQRRIIDALRRDDVLTDAELTRYIAPSTGALNEEGILFIEKTLAGTVITDADLLASMPRSALSKIVRALPALGRARLAGKEWDVSPQLANAARLLVEAERAGMPLGDYAKQEDLFGGGTPRAGIVLGLAKSLQKLTPKEFAGRMTRFAGEASRTPKGQATLGFYEAPKPEEATKALAAAEARGGYGQQGQLPLVGRAEQMRAFQYVTSLKKAAEQKYASGYMAWLLGARPDISRPIGAGTMRGGEIRAELEGILGKRAAPEASKIGEVSTFQADSEAYRRLDPEAEERLLKALIDKGLLPATKPQAPKPAKDLKVSDALTARAMAPELAEQAEKERLGREFAAANPETPFVAPLRSIQDGYIFAHRDTYPTTTGQWRVTYFTRVGSFSPVMHQHVVYDSYQELVDDAAGSWGADLSAAKLITSEIMAVAEAGAQLRALPTPAAQAQMGLPWEGFDKVPGEKIIPGQPRTVDLRNYRLVLKEVGTLPLKGAKIESAHDLAFIFDSLKSRPVEAAYALYAKDGVPLAAEMLSLGTFSSAKLYPRHFMDSALALGANEIYMAHNHPSGDPVASRDDIDVGEKFTAFFKTGQVKFGGGVVIDGPEKFGFVSVDEAGRTRGVILPLRKGRPRGKVPVVEKVGERPADWKGYSEMQPADMAGSYLAAMKDPGAPSSMFFFTSKGGDVRGTAIFDKHWTGVLEDRDMVQTIRKLMADTQSGYYLAATNENLQHMGMYAFANAHSKAFGEVPAEHYQLGAVVHSISKSRAGEANFSTSFGGKELDYSAVRGEAGKTKDAEIRFGEAAAVAIPAPVEIIEMAPSSQFAYGIDPVKRTAVNQSRMTVINVIVKRALDVPHPARGEWPVLTLLAGGWGSGKSTTRKAIETGREVVSDADAFKAKLPEWKREIGRGNGGIAPWLHEESSMISKIVADRAIDSGRNLIYDTSGTNIPRMLEIAKRAKGRGYLVRYIYVHATAEQGQARSDERAKKTGRGTDTSEALRRNHRDSARAFFRMIDDQVIDEWRLIDARAYSKASIAAQRTPGEDPEVTNSETLQSLKDKAMIRLEGELSEKPQTGSQLGRVEPQDRGELRPREGVRGLPAGEFAVAERPPKPKAPERLEPPPKPTAQPRAVVTSEGLVPNRSLRRKILIDTDTWAEASFRDQEEQRLYDIGRVSLRVKDGLGSSKDAQILARAKGLGLIEKSEATFFSVRTRTRKQPSQMALPTAAGATPPAVPGGTVALGRARSILARGRKGKPGPPSLGAGGPRWIRRARAQVVAEFSPLGSAEKAIYRAAQQAAPGLGLDKKFEIVAGAPGKAEADLYDFKAGVTDAAGKNLDRLEEYMLLRRIESRLLTDPETKRVADWKIDQARAGLVALRSEIGVDRFTKIEKIASEAYQRVMDLSLRLQVDSGRMAQEVYDRIKKENPFYAPFGVLRHLGEFDAVTGSGRRIATTQDLTKAIRGIDDPDFALVSLLDRSAEQIVKSRVLAEKNLAMLSLAELAAVDKKGILVRKVSPGTRPRPHYKEVRYFDKGVESALEVHPELARAVQGLTRGEAELVDKIAAAGATALRAGATTFNVGFQMVNMPFADLPELALLSKYGIRNPLDLVRFPFDVGHALYSSVRGNFGKPNDLYMRFLRSGAANSTISRVLRPGAWAGPTGPRARRLASTVLDTASKITSSLEETTKVAGYLRGERIEGLARLSGEAKARKLEEIASEVRNYAGSPDFARRGEMRQLNLMFMFFNARLQGVSRDLAVLAGPKGGARMAAAWARLAVAVGLPAIFAWFLNRAPENKDDYDERDEWERENYFLIPMYGGDGKPQYVVNEDGERVRDYRRVPKREVVKLYANTIEAGLDYLQKEDSKAIVRLPEQIFENLSPVGIQGEDLTERMESVVSSLNPILRAPIEFATGRKTFQHAPTVPESLKRMAPEEQYYAGVTQDAFVWLGKKLKVSPLKLEQLAYGVTGGGLTQFTPRAPAAGRPKWSTLPGAQRFFGATRLSHRDLYAAYHQSAEVMATMNKMLREGRGEEAMKYGRDHAAEMLAHDMLKPLVEYLGETRQARRTRAAFGTEAPMAQEGVGLTKGIRDILHGIETMKRRQSESATQRPRLEAVAK